LPALLLSGFAFPINAMPEVIQLITYFNPMRYFIELTRSIFLKGTGFNILWPKLVALLAIGLALFYFSSRKFAKHLE
jgi:ABC-2 type transport system permease protein